MPRMWNCFIFVRCDLRIKLNNTILILTIMQKHLRIFSSCELKYILSVQTDLILVEYIQKTTPQWLISKEQVALYGICTSRCVYSFVFVFFFNHKIVKHPWLQLYDNRMLGKPQELEQMRFQVESCITYCMNHLSDLCNQGWHPLFGTRLRFPAIHTCLNTERQGHLNLTATVWPKHHVAPQLDCYIRSWKSNTFFFFFLYRYCTIKGLLVCRRQLSLHSTCKTSVVCCTCV